MSLPAVKAAFAAERQGRFWEFHDKIFADFRNLTPEKLNQIAVDLGLDMTRYAKDMTSPEVQQHINRDLREAQQAEVNGTPTIFINGFRVQNRSLQGIQADDRPANCKRSGKRLMPRPICLRIFKNGRGFNDLVRSEAEIRPTMRPPASSTAISTATWPCRKGHGR